MQAKATIVAMQERRGTFRLEIRRRGRPVERWRSGITSEFEAKARGRIVAKECGYDFRDETKKPPRAAQGRREERSTMSRPEKIVEVPAGAKVNKAGKWVCIGSKKQAEPARVTEKDGAVFAECPVCLANRKTERREDGVVLVAVHFARGKASSSRAEPAQNDAAGPVQEPGEERPAIVEQAGSAPREAKAECPDCGKQVAKSGLSRHRKTHQGAAA